MVFGAITGVGIWWIIGLASPLATELLIRTFVFGWATEWVFFVYHCNDCHAAREGYSAVGPLLRGRPHDMILQTVQRLETAQFFMPAWAGTPEEAELMTDYLMSISPPRPEGMRVGTRSENK